MVQKITKIKEFFEENIFSKIFLSLKTEPWCDIRKNFFCYFDEFGYLKLKNEKIEKKNFWEKKFFFQKFFKSEN